MFVLKNIFSSGKAVKPRNTGPETAPVKMNLEERMAFRRELLFEAIKVTMQAHGVLSSSYKTKVVRNDKRGHQYSVMMDLSTDFLHNEEGRPEKLLALGTAIAKNSEERYGLKVVGVYWQVNAMKTSRASRLLHAKARAVMRRFPPPRPQGGKNTNARRLKSSPHSRRPGRKARRCRSVTASIRLTSLRWATILQAASVRC